jgi:hypothetical protein
MNEHLPLRPLSGYARPKVKHSEVTSVHADSSSRWKSLGLSLLVHGAIFLALAGIVLVPGSKMMAKIGLSVPVDLVPPLDSPFGQEDGSASSALSESDSLPLELADVELTPDPREVPLVTEQELAGLIGLSGPPAPGMAPLIQMATAFSAPHSLPVSTGKGAGSFFGSGSGTSQGNGGGGSGKLQPPVRSTASMAGVEDGTMVDGWMFLGNDQNGAPYFVHPSDTVIWFDDEKAYSNMSQKKAVWLSRFRKAGFHTEPWPWPLADGRIEGIRYSDSVPFHSGNILAGLKKMRSLKRSTLVAMGPFLLPAVYEYPPHFRALLKEVGEMSSRGERLVFGFTVSQPSIHYQRLLREGGQSWVRMDGPTDWFPENNLPELHEASRTEVIYRLGRNVEAVHAASWNWLMTANHSPESRVYSKDDPGKRNLIPLWDKEFLDIFRALPESNPKHHRPD